ncbi:ATP-binding cassette domain-containing protein [Thermoflexibacter ruber]|uniref:ABC-2 type transport system ATP-binding protein n=1 Tax=Thermoflexibacter ruber TaxID=1003 RepID=A0A1I2JSF0_9BACT|nr:ABC transporter ATP-binding protein [Thermoflexibacter ruber]SFF56903.1 ABC-2 type transport system ATP-binding protein [Thermoflexibacter ruber]
MLEIKELIKKFGNKTVLNIPYLKIEKNESIGVVGNNGAGKTTLFRLLLDLLKADNGAILFDNKNITQTEDWKVHTGSFLEQGFLIPFLTTIEYFKFVSTLYKMQENVFQLQLEKYQDFLTKEITQNKRKYIRDFSQGNKVKIGIVAAMLSNPQLLILDEPFANLDPSSQIRLKSIIKDLVINHKTTVLISSHDLRHITDVSERIILIDEGKIIKDSPKSEKSLQELETYFINQIETI